MLLLWANAHTRILNHSPQLALFALVTHTRHDCSFVLIKLHRILDDVVKNLFVELVLDHESNWDT